MATSTLPRPMAFEFRRPSTFDLPAFKTPSTTLEDRPSLPSIGHEISRPSSTSTTASYTQLRRENHAAIQLPALSTLASIASSSPSANAENNASEAGSRSGTPPKMASPPPPSKPNKALVMTYATPASAPATAGNAPPQCMNCSTSTTPLWRRDESGSVLCNACGLFLKLHGRPRPISLKTDVIKSRNRVKTGSGRKKSGETGLAAAHPDADPNFAFQQQQQQQQQQHRRASEKIPSGLSERSQSPISRTGTPAFTHQSNIAPQHMFDAASGMNPEAFHSPSLSGGFTFRQPSPGATSSVNGSHLEPPLSYDFLANQYALTKTRASELEVINDLFRGRVAELETSEQEARQREGQLRQELEESRQREAELKRRLDEYEGEGPRPKKMRMSDLVDESRAGTPLSSLGD